MGVFSFHWRGMAVFIIELGGMGVFYPKDIHPWFSCACREDDEDESICYTVDVDS